jgi:hypothetical protein
MGDRTAARRVQNYRIRQKADRGIKRVEVQVPAFAAEDIKGLSKKFLAAFGKAVQADRQVKSVLTTINVPRPAPIDVNDFVHCLLTREPDARWRPHMEALFDEVSPEAIHDLVLAGIVSFEDLYRAARTWGVTDGRNVGWVHEMADLRLAKLVA